MTFHHNLFITLCLLLAFIKQTSGLIRRGSLTVEPGPLVLRGSDLIVHCHYPNCARRFTLILEVKDVTVRQGVKFNCTTSFHLFNVTTPKTTVLCKLKEDTLQVVVAGLTLRSGRHPDKPKNISCETTKLSDYIECLWDKGRETHVATDYSVSLFHRSDDATHVLLPRSILANETLYQLKISAYNHFGDAHSDLFSLCVENTVCPFSLAVIPESPQIKQVKFGDDPSAAILEWETPEDPQNLTLQVNLSSAGGFWEVKEPTWVSEDQIRVNGLEPLSEYAFQIRTCGSTSGEKPVHCSKWSRPFARRTPGRGPSKAPQTWRIVGERMTDGLRTVTVMWKALPAGEFSGKLENYSINFKDAHKEEVMCPAAQSQCDVLVPPQVSALNVSVVASYGTSPPSHVLLIQSAVPGPVIRDLTPSANGSSVLVSWSHLSNSGDLLNFVIEWTSVPAAGLWWKTASVGQNTSIITGLTAGVRFKVSLYAVTTTGVSAPSSRLFYSRELKPLLGPSLSFLHHEKRRVLIQWADLAVDQQRGFLTHYNVYVQTLDPQHTELVVKVSASGPRKKELDCPEGPLAIQMTSSNSAGEGPRGGLVFSHPKPHTAGLMMVLVILISLFIVIIANLLCWSYLRKRMKEKCMSWELRNSKAIRLLEQEKIEPLFSPSFDEPPLSPITWVREENEVYPKIKAALNQSNSGEQHLSTGLSPAAAENSTTNQLEHDSYKPQVSTLAAQRVDGSETAVGASGADDDCPRFVANLLDDHMTNVPMRFSPEFVNGNLTAGNGSNFLRSTWRNIDVDSVVVDSQLEENLCSAIHLPQDKVVSTPVSNVSLVTGGYFPQMPTIHMDDESDTKR